MTSQIDALTVRCPQCGAGKGAPCVYVIRHFGGVQDRWPYVPFVVHFEGDPMERVHNGRLRAVRERDLRRKAQENRRVTPASRAAVESAAALRAWDLAEYERLRDWLRDYGYLLTEANLPHRPDGTLRGETYLFGP